ncbi:MAG: hypothetical protein ACPLXS_01685 [Candidatus Micrarchaeales archaeon]
MLEIAIEIITIMFCISGIAFGIGVILDNEKIKNFAKKEVLECFFNSFLVASAFLLFGKEGIVQKIVNSLLNASSTCPKSIEFNSASCFAYSFLIGEGYYLNGNFYPSLSQQTISVLLSILLLNVFLGFVSGFGINLGISFDISKVFSSFFSILSTVTSALSISLISIMAQAYLILFVSSIGIALLLPLSIVLRSFIVTRKMGSLLFAFFISFTYIFPLTYYLNALLFQKQEINFNEFQNQTQEQIKNLTISNIPYLLNNIKDETSKILTQIFSFVGYILIKSIFIPAFSFALAWLSMQEISQLLGNEIQIKVNIL